MRCTTSRARLALIWIILSGCSGPSGGSSDAWTDAAEVAPPVHDVRTKPPDVANAPDDTGADANRPSDGENPLDAEVAEPSDAELVTDETAPPDVPEAPDVEEPDSGETEVPDTPTDTGEPIDAGPPPCGLVSGEPRVPVFAVAPPMLLGTSAVPIEITGSPPSEIYISGVIYAPNGTAIPTPVLATTIPWWNYRVEAADIDGDGRADLVYFDDDGVHALRQVSWGTFAGVTSIPGDFVDFATGDVDGDGASDVLVRIIGVQMILRTYRFGANGFELQFERVLTTTEDDKSASSPIYILDLDGDGFGELVSGLVYFNVPGVGFVSQNLFGLTPNEHCDTRLVDYDLDGDVDTVCASPSPTMHVLKNDGGVLQLLTVPSYFPGYWILGFWDFDGDGKTEALMGLGTSAPGVAVLARGPAGSTTTLFSRDDIGGSPRVVDVDGDGDLDIYMTVTYTGMDLYLNDGTGNFRVLRRTSIPFSVEKFVAADFDGDGLDDVALSDGESIIWLRSQGDGTFEPGKVSAPPLNHLPFYKRFETFFAKDVDDDGRAELVITSVLYEACAAPPPVHVLTVQADGTLEPRPIAGLVGNTLDAGDVDGDGTTDLVQVVSFEGTAAVACPETITVPWNYESDPTTGLFGCYELPEGCPIACTVAETACATPLSEVRLAVGDGTGGFGPWQVVPLSLVDPKTSAACLSEYPDAPGDLRLVDANGDDRLDILVGDAYKAFAFADWFVESLPSGNYGPETLHVGWGTGQLRTFRVYANLGGTFASAPDRSLVYPSEDGIELADIDGDGYADLVMSDRVSLNAPDDLDYGTSVMGVSRNNVLPNGSSVPVVSSGPTCSVYYVPTVPRFADGRELVGFRSGQVPHAANLNGDRCDDLAMTAKGANPGQTGTLRLLLGQPAGLGLDIEIPQPGDSRYSGTLVSGDFDGDGKSDLLVINGGTGFVLLNTTEWPALIPTAP